MGGLFIAVGLLIAVTIVATWAQTALDLGGTTSAVGVLLFALSFAAVGTALVLGLHVPLIRALREMGESHRRGD